MAVSQIATVFKLDRNGLRVARGVAIMALMVLPLIVLNALDLEDYWVSLVFGLLFVWISDPGGGLRVPGAGHGRGRGARHPQPAVRAAGDRHRLRPNPRPRRTRRAP